MKVAIVQPYFLPYLGYFQLINAVDVFVFYDDVNFIKKGWIHRNRLIMNKEEKMFTIPLRKASQNKLICEISTAIDQNWIKTFLKNIEYNYKKAPFFIDVMPLMSELFAKEELTIAELAIKSIEVFCDYLGIGGNFKISSADFNESKGMPRADRLIQITKALDADTYVNPANGRALYDKDYFQEQDINLLFIENELPRYSQMLDNFVPGLSILDVVMHNSVEDCQAQLGRYKLI